MSSIMVYAAAMTMSAAGQQGATPRVAVVNLARVFDKLAMVRDLEQMFEDQRQQISTEAKKKGDALKTQEAALAQFKPGSADFIEREERLSQDRLQFQWWLDRQERNLKQEHKSWLISIYRQVEDSVAELAQSRAIDLVLTYTDLDTEAPDSMAFRQQILLRPVIFANNRVDLTNDVVETLETEYRNQGGAATLQLGKPAPDPATATP
jgi:Skp family chaperone for outer membrane proteins